MNPATRAPKAYAFRMIDSVQVIDKYTVKIKLKEPFAPLLSTLTIHTCPIIPAKDLEIISEDLPALYLSKSVTGNAFRDYMKGFRKGFGTRFSWYGGGAMYWWLDK